MNKIEKILIERDGLTPEEARKRRLEVTDMILSSLAEEADDILMDELCLEPDFLIDLFE